MGMPGRPRGAPTDRPAPFPRCVCQAPPTRVSTVSVMRGDQARGWCRTRYSAGSSVCVWAG